MKLLIVGDLHFSRNLSYFEYVKDGRVQEKKEILETIINNSKDVDSIVLLGDNFNIPNPTSDVIRDFTNLLESFGDKEVFILTGNHEFTSDGRSACDYLKEIKGKKWHVISGEIKTFGEMTFLPYLTNSFLGVNNNEEAKEKIMSMLSPNKFLFLHHSVSNLFISSNISTNDLPEVVLPQEELSKMFKLIMLGHIHSSSSFKNVIVSGSIFKHSISDSIKYIWKLDTETLNIDKIKLPGRIMKKIEDPKDEQINELPEDSIVKIVLTKKITSVELGELKDKLEKRFSEKGAYLLIDQTSIIRERDEYKDDIINLSMDYLLEEYSKQKEVDLIKLKKGWELIND